MMATQHTKKHPDRFKLSKKSSKRPVHNKSLRPPVTCKIKLSRINRAPAHIPVIYEAGRENEPDGLEGCIKEIEEYLGMPGEFAKYFNDPEIQFLRSDKEASDTLMQAFQKDKVQRTVSRMGTRSFAF